VTARYVRYRPEYGLEVVKLWRQSFQRAMRLPEHNDFDELSGHLDYLTSIDPATINLLIEPASSQIVAFMSLSGDYLRQLYVHVDRQGQGLGSQLLNRAKAESGGGLELYTFERNVGAQAFYLAHGFREIERGQAAAEDNPWATSPDQLADIRYRWDPDGR